MAERGQEPVPTDYVTYNAMEEEPRSFGLDAPELTAALESENGDTDSVTDYTRIGFSPIVYRITQHKYSSLKTMARNELRHQEFFTRSTPSFSVQQATDFCQFSLFADAAFPSGLHPLFY